MREGERTEGRKAGSSPQASPRLSFPGDTSTAAQLGFPVSPPPPPSGPWTWPLVLQGSATQGDSWWLVAASLSSGDKASG